MKKIWVIILWLCCLSLVWNIAQAKDYEYTNLDITANILEDWTINVQEDFTANFFVNKHWIIRAIPLNYTVKWDKFHIDISDISVEWKKFSTSQSNWEIEIKIWDADYTVIWKQNYPISYSVYGLIKNFSWMGYAELYWNLVGYDFDTNINKVHTEIILPKIYTWFTADDFLITTDWKSKTIDWFEWSVDWSKWDKIIITYDKWLSAYQWITLAIKFPNNYFIFDHNKQANLIGNTENSFTNNDEDYTSLIWGLFVILSILSVIIAYIKKNRRNKWYLKWEFAKQFPVIVQYEPPKWLNSAEVGILFHRKAEAKDMLSLIYGWAAEWLIKISTEKSEWNFLSKSQDAIVLTKCAEMPDDAPDYERSFFKSLITSDTNKIEKYMNLYQKLHLSKLEEYSQSKWRFNKNKSTWCSIFWIFILLTFVWVPLLSAYDSNLGETFFSVLRCILLFLGMFWGIFLNPLEMKETEEWARLISHILWYKEFLTACDENKLRLFLKQDPLYFDKILPYAVVFWLETELLKKLEPLLKEMNINSSVYWDLNSIYIMNDIISSSATRSVPPTSSYSSSSGHSSWSSFSGWFSHGWWGGGWGGRSW